MMDGATVDGTVIAVGDNAARKKEAEAHAGEFFPILMGPGAFVAKDVTVGEGTVIMSGAIIQTGAQIGKHCILNTGCSVDHDCILGDYVHIAPGAHLCGHVEVGEGSLVGVCVGIAPGCIIPAWSLVKARRLEIVPLSGN
jgi:UDP-3-O-[3-hydroxymyristoyl] glucosamine N-acyltransferase